MIQVKWQARLPPRIAPEDGAPTQGHHDLQEYPLLGINGRFMPAFRVLAAM
jgi:hypothetical protein